MRRRRIQKKKVRGLDAVLIAASFFKK